MQWVAGIAVLLAASGPALAQDSWDYTKAQMLNRRNMHACAGAGGYLYVFAGWTVPSSFVHSNHRYDPVTDAWTTRATIYDYDGGGYITNVGWENPAGASANGKIYQFCGTVRWSGISVSDNAAYEYDPAADAWAYLPAAPVMGPSWAVETGGKIYIATPTYSSTTSLVEFDPVSKTYSTKPALSGDRYGFYLGALAGKVYVAGGDDFSGSLLDTLHEFDTTSNTWSLKSARMPMGNAYGAFASAKARFFAIGGWADDYTNTFAYNPATDAWETLARMPSPAYGHAAGVVTSQGSTKVHVTGGDNDSQWRRNYHAIYSPPALPRPSDPSGLFMRTPGGDDLPHGSFCGTQIVLGAQLADPNGLQVSLEVEVAMNGTAFTGNPTHVQPFQAAGEASVSVSLTGGAYKWRVRCRNTNEEENPAGWMEFGPSDPDFTVDNTPPSVPSPLSPRDTTVTTAVLYPSPVTFTWVEATDDSAAAISYEIQVTKDATFTVVERVGTGAGSSGTVHLSWSDVPLYWRVRAVDAYGNAGAWSAVSSFMLAYDDNVDNGAGDGQCSASASSSGLGLALALLLAVGAGLRRSASSGQR